MKPATDMNTQWTAVETKHGLRFCNDEAIKGNNPRRSATRMTAAIPCLKGDAVPQFTFQELKWIDQSQRRDIDNSKEMLSAYPDPPPLAALVDLDVANKKALRAKITQTMERMKQRAARQR